MIKMDTRYTYLSDSVCKYSFEVGNEVLKEFFNEKNISMISHHFMRGFEGYLGYVPTFESILKHDDLSKSIQYLSYNLTSFEVVLKNRVKDYEEGAYWTEEELVPGKTNPKGN